MNNQIPSEILEKMFKDRLIRREVTSRNFWFFILFYFGNYITYKPAPFHYEMFSLIEDVSIETLIIQAFRGSGKTTIINQFYPIWSILGQQKKKYIVILGQTMLQAKQHLKNIKAELESNDLLKNDLGPFKEYETWNSYSLSIPEHNAQIIAASSEQGIRGTKNRPYRPDLIILDDVEDINSVKTRESRDNIYRWVTGDVLPLGDKNTRIIMIGNHLHEDGLLMRFINEINQNLRSGTYRRYPLLDNDNNIAWRGKYPTMIEIKKEKMRIGNEVAWQREYLLQIISPDDQIIKREWIKYYETLPDRDDPKNQYRMAAIAIDPGIKSDPTAIVAAHAFGSGDNAKIYISPNFFNKQATLLEIISEITKRSDSMNYLGRSRVIIEDVAAQAYIIELVREKGYAVESFKPRISKEERLHTISSLIESGRVMFDRGCADIVNQCVNFGFEKHDDLCDSLVMVVSVLINIVGHNSTRMIEQSKSNNSDYWPKDESGIRVRKIRLDTIF